MATARSAFKDFFPGSSFNYFFWDDYYNRQYVQDIQYQRMIGFFSWLALFIVVLGIISMSGFMLLKRRKVMGAGTVEILRLLNMHFLRLLVLAYVMALPVARLIMDGLLRNFANRTGLSGWIPAAAVVIAFVVTVVTVPVLSLRTARRHPVEALRVE